MKTNHLLAETVFIRIRQPSPAPFTLTRNSSHPPSSPTDHHSSHLKPSSDISFESSSAPLSHRPSKSQCLPRKQLLRRRKRRPLPPHLTHHTKVRSLPPPRPQRGRIISRIDAAGSRTSADSFRTRHDQGSHPEGMLLPLRVTRAPHHATNHPATTTTSTP